MGAGGICADAPMIAPVHVVPPSVLRKTSADGNGWIELAVAKGFEAEVPVKYRSAPGPTANAFGVAPPSKLDHTSVLLVSNLATKPGPLSRNAVLSGKFVESVEPARYAFPAASAAVAFTVSVPLPPK